MKTIRRLRTILFFILLIITTVLWTSFIILMIIIPYKYRHLIATTWADAVIFLARFVAGINWQLEGEFDLQDKAAVIIVNHQSAWETIFLPTLLRKQVWVLKKELLYIPFFGWAMALLRPIAIDRKRKKVSLQQIVEQGKARIEQGYCVVMFPEGTRVKAGENIPFKSGAARLAVSIGARVIPVAHNAGLFWPKKGCLHEGTVRVCIGDAIDSKEMTIEQLNDKVEKWIKNKRDAMVASELRQRN